jgi:hypothetical protein
MRVTVFLTKRRLRRLSLSIENRVRSRFSLLTHGLRGIRKVGRLPLIRKLHINHGDVRRIEDLLFTVLRYQPVRFLSTATIELNGTIARARSTSANSSCRGSRSGVGAAVRTRDHAREGGTFPEGPTNAP